MHIDGHGIASFSQNEICELLYKNKDFDISSLMVDDPSVFNASNKKLHAGLSELKKYLPIQQSILEFDQSNQKTWFIPDEYKNFDIETWLFDQCKNDESRQRVELELSLFKQTNLIILIKYLKYLIDIMTDKNIVWGVGRGSSTASYILYLIGLHVVDPIKYDIPIDEFFKQGTKNV